MAYQAPLEELRFLVNELVDLPAAAAGDEMMSPDLAVSIWEEAGKFAVGVLEPLNAFGDRKGLKLDNGVVTTPEGFKDAYRRLIENGWNNVAVPETAGGQGLPWIVSAPITEMFSSANKAFNMCAGLTLGAIEALNHAGSDELKARFLHKMVSGEWTGTMNLTEPQAGSDVGAIRTRAILQDDGSYRISGQKIYISFGEHDMAENIVHLVLARTPDAPEGVRGISMFLVPKYLVDADGNLGARNDVKCLALEHKLGIHASPTCVLSFGEEGGAEGYLVGELNKGLAAMFVMMNSARLAVGLEGVGAAEAARQKALAYALERVQGSDMIDASRSVVIAEHADVRRMLLLMESRTRALRAMALIVAEAQDLSERAPEKAERARQLQFLSLMTPIFKAYSTEAGVDIASQAIQIHGGMGFVEETGVAQIWRDARISPIYEGTTGIQAADLVNRKLLRDGGEGFAQLTSRIQTTLAQARRMGVPLAAVVTALSEALEFLESAVAAILATDSSKLQNVQFISVPFLTMAGHTIGGWLLLQGAVRALQAKENGGQYADSLLTSWLQSAEFFGRYVLAEVGGVNKQVMNYLESDVAVPDLLYLKD